VLGSRSFRPWVHIVSESSPLVGFDELNDNAVKGLTSLLSVE
jgi:hypothetical protein